MKLATRLALGFALVVCLLLGTLLEQSYAAWRTERDLERVVEHELGTLSRTGRLLEELDALERTRRRFSVTHDPAFARQAGELAHGIQQRLKDLEESRVHLEVPGRWGSEGRDILRLRQSVRGLRRAIEERISRRARAARRRSDRAEEVSLLLAAAALAASLAVPATLASAFRRRTRSLLEAAREMSCGHFEYRLDGAVQDEFAPLAAQFNRMARSLGELEQLKSDFLSHVSHELKSPLGSIQETIRLLLEELAGPLDPVERRLLELGLASARRLDSMVDKLLQMARIEAQGPEPERQERDLNTIARAAALQFSPLLERDGVKIEVRLSARPLPVRCDRDQMTQVIFNLLENACRHSPCGSRVELSSHARGQVALLSIRDQGPGIPARQRQQVLARFQQGARGARGRLGLGLSICRSILEWHGGGIDLGEAPGGGALVTARLPLKRGKAWQRAG